MTSVSCVKEIVKHNSQGPQKKEDIKLNLPHPHPTVVVKFRYFIKEICYKGDNKGLLAISFVWDVPLEVVAGRSPKTVVEPLSEVEGFLSFGWVGSSPSEVGARSGAPSFTEVVEEGHKVA